MGADFPRQPQSGLPREQATGSRLLRESVPPSDRHSPECRVALRGRGLRPGDLSRPRPTQGQGDLHRQPHRHRGRRCQRTPTGDLRRRALCQSSDLPAGGAGFARAEPERRARAGGTVRARRASSQRSRCRDRQQSAGRSIRLAERCEWHQHVLHVGSLGADPGRQSGERRAGDGRLQSFPDTHAGCRNCGDPVPSPGGLGRQCDTRTRLRTQRRPREPPALDRPEQDLQFQLPIRFPGVRWRPADSAIPAQRSGRKSVDGR